jgi:hypothetical protein
MSVRDSPQPLFLRFIFSALCSVGYEKMEFSFVIARSFVTKQSMGRFDLTGLGGCVKITLFRVRCDSFAGGEVPDL